MNVFQNEITAADSRACGTSCPAGDRAWTRGPFTTSVRAYWGAYLIIVVTLEPLHFSV